jgi:glutathione S-transferase
MSVTLYELAGENPDLRFSPYCWRIRFALAHKGLTVAGLPWRFTETERLAFSGQGKVPVLVDGDKVVHDSWSIAEYLDDTYPDRPSLFPGTRAHARFINAWADSTLQAGMAPLIVADVHKVLAPVDAAYFRSSREARLGRSLEEISADRATRVTAFRSSLTPLRLVLKAQPWLGGERPDYADYIIAGAFQWARCTSRFALLEPTDPVAIWFTAVLALFDGLGARAVTV